MNVYDVIKYETELGDFDDGERINTAGPVGLVDAVTLAAEVVNHYVRGEGLDRYRLDGSTPITNSSARQRWHLHHERYPERKLVVDVVEVSGEAVAS